MIIKYILLLTTLTLFTSCSFNNIFLHPTQVPPNAKTLTLTAENDTTVVKFSADNYQPTFLKNGKDTIDFNFTIESIVFKSSNGNKLNGWMLKPKNKIPTITLLHFHGNAGFIISQYRTMTNLLNYGYQVFLFDYSGFGFSEGHATRENLLLDANSALSYVKSRTDIKDTKLVIYGHSLGGHLSAVVAEQRQTDIDGLVIEGAFSSHKDIAAKRAGFIGRLLVSEKYSAYKSIRAYKKPVLVIHSTEDKVIPFNLGQKIYQNANAPKEFYEIKECHMCGPLFYADSISQKIKKMLIVN